MRSSTATGEATNVVLAITVDAGGEFYLDGTRAQEPELRARVREARGRDPELRAVIAADAGSRHGSVVKVIDLLRQERVNRFAINVEPQDVQTR